jgi:hypothetical protein
MITEQIGKGGRSGDLKQAVSIVITDYDFISETKRCRAEMRRTGWTIYGALLKARRDGCSRVRGAPALRGWRPRIIPADLPVSTAELLMQ